MVRKSQKRQPRKRNKSRRVRKYTKSGGCGCNKQILIGGSANLDALSKEYYYSYNSKPDYFLKGGKRKRVRGGVGLLTSAYSLGPALDLQNVNTLMGTNTGANPDITVQPASNAYQDNAIPIV